MTPQWNARHFSPQEFRCHDGTDVPADLMGALAALASQLDVIREEWGSPLEVVSGYRTVSYNHAVKGATLSQHMLAKAADIRPYVLREGHSVRWELLHESDRLDVIVRFEECIGRLMGAQRLPLVGGLGIYPGKWLHVDVRPRPADGHVARWTGVGVGSES